MQFEYDPAQLIHEVKKRPGIWNSNVKEHKSKTARDRLWREVVKALNTATEELSAGDIHELELQLQKRWKSMRDTFMKQLNNPQKYKRARPYIYFDDLKFLKAIMKKRQHDDDDDEKEESNIDRNAWKKKAVAAIQEADSEDTYEDVTYLGDDDEEDEEVVLEPARVRSPNVQNFVFADVETSPPHISSPRKDENDPDRLFLLSLLPNLKGVPKHMKLAVKMSMMQVIQNALESSNEYDDGDNKNFVV